MLSSWYYTVDSRGLGMLLAYAMTPMTINLYVLAFVDSSDQTT